MFVDTVKNCRHYALSNNPQLMHTAVNVSYLYAKNYSWIAFCV